MSERVDNLLMALLVDCDSNLSAYGHGRPLLKEDAIALSTRCRRAVAALATQSINPVSDAGQPPSSSFRLAQARQDVYQILVGGAPHGRVSDVLDELIAAVLEGADLIQPLPAPPQTPEGPR